MQGLSQHWELANIMILLTGAAEWFRDMAQAEYTDYAWHNIKKHNKVKMLSVIISYEST